MTAPKIKTKRELARYLMELEQLRTSRPIDNYHPHSGQRPFHLDRRTTRIVLGGNQPLDPATLVKTSLQNIPLGDIRPGTTVWAWDDYRLRRVLTVVEEVLIFGHREKYKLYTAAGRSVVATQNHAFWVRRRSQKQPTAMTLGQIQLWVTNSGLIYMRLDDGQEDLITAVEPYGTGEVRCLRIRHASHLFCLANGIITHNSGKTTAGCAEAIWHFTGTHPHREVSVPNTGRIVSAQGFQNGIDQVIWPKLKSLMPRNFIKKLKRGQTGAVSYIEGVNGSMIHFNSGEQASHTMEGTTLNWVWFDEPVDRDIYIANIRGLLRTGGSCWFTMTPLSEPWIYDELWLPGMEGIDRSIGCHIIDIEQNYVGNGGYLTRAAIDKFADNLSEEEKESRLRGKFMHLSGLVYKEFNRTKHVVPPPKSWPADWPVWRAIDPHTKTPHHALWVGITPENDYMILQELKLECTLPELAKEVLRLSEPYLIIESLIDTSINVNDGIYRINQRKVLEQHGLRCRFPSKRDNLIPGIMEIKRLLTKPSLFVAAPCRGTIYEFQRYRWNTKTERPIMENDHFLDCYDGKTEVLTKRGWRLFRDVTKQDWLATLNLHTQRKEWQQPLALIHNWYKGRMFHFLGRDIDLRVTKNHRMLLSERGKYVIKKASFTYKGDFIGSAKIAERQYSMSSEDVWCATVPNGTLFVRRNRRAVWCGNCLRYVVIASPRHNVRPAIGSYLKNKVETYGNS